MKKTSVPILIILSILAFSIAACGGKNDGGAEPLAASLSEVSGTVQTMAIATGVLEDASDGTMIAEGDQVITHSDSRARLDISDGTIVRIGPYSAFTLVSARDNGGGLLGKFKLDIGSGFRLEITRSSVNLFLK